MKTAAIVSGIFMLTLHSCSAKPDRPDVVADLACETARMVVNVRQELAPAPASDKCTNCDGTGKIGDGRIVMTCPVCKGTGKKCTTGACKP